MLLPIAKTNQRKNFPSAPSSLLQKNNPVMIVDLSSRKNLSCFFTQKTKAQTHITKHCCCCCCRHTTNT